MQTIISLRIDIKFTKFFLTNVVGCEYNISVNKNSLLTEALIYLGVLDKSKIFVYNTSVMVNGRHPIGVAGTQNPKLMPGVKTGKLAGNRKT